MASKKSESESTALRRSSRSTRGSVKPIVDLSKADRDTDDTDVNKVDEEDDDEVQIIDSSDDEYEETTHKPKRGSKAKGKAAQAKVDKKVEISKPRNRDVKNAKTSVKTSTKAPKSSGKSSKPKEQEVEEIAEDLEDIYYQLDEKEMKEVNNAFDLNCSSDGEELLSSETLKAAIRSLGFEPRADEIQKLIKKFVKKSDKINRDGFQKIMAFKMSSAPSTNDKTLNDEISKVFNLLDLDKTGKITLENLRAISKELNEEITEEELLEMIEAADHDGDMQINKDEFYNIMKKTSLY